MKHVISYMKLGRPLSSLTGAITTLLGGYVAGTGAWFDILLASLVTFLISAAGFAWNDYLDVKIDRINQPQRAIPSGKVSPEGALLFAIGLTLIALGIASFLNTAAFIIAIAATIMLYIYSWKLKSTILLGNITTACIAGASAIFGGMAAGNVKPSLWLALIVITAITGREILKALADYEGDIQHQCHTIATVWGKTAARILFKFLAIIMLIVMLLPLFFNVYKPVYGLVVIVGIYPVILYIVLNVKRDSTGQQLEKLSQILKYDFLVWFVAVFLGASAF